MPYPDYATEIHAVDNLFLFPMQTSHKMLDKIHRILIGLVILGSPWIILYSWSIWSSITDRATHTPSYDAIGYTVEIAFWLLFIPINVFGASAVFLTLTKFSKIRIIIIAAIIFSAYTIFIYVLISTSNAYF